MILPRATRIQELPREPLSKIFPTIGSALSVQWEKTCSRWRNRTVILPDAVFF